MALTKSVSTMVEEAIIRLSEETGIDASKNTSITKFLIQDSCERAKELWDTYISSDSSRRLSSATGTDLDELGAMVGCTRRPIWIATSSSLAMQFSLAQALSVDIAIPSGTLVWPTNDVSRYFLTTSTVTIPAGATKVFTGIRAPYSGNLYSATTNELTSHSADTRLSCTNLEAIAGTSEEDDDRYRYRISLALQARNGSLPSAVQLKILEFPGIVETKLVPFQRGAGTFDVMVTTVETTPTQTKLDEIRDYITNNVAAYGVSVRVVGPRTYAVDIVVRLGIAAAVSPSQKIALRQQASSVLQQYINTRDIGEALYMDRLEYTAMSISQDILDVAIVSLSINGTQRTPDTITVDTFERIIAGSIEVV